MKKLFVLVLSMVLLVTMAGCGPDTNIEVNTPDASIQLNTPGVNPLANEPAENGRVAGVLQGLWHGLIAPVTLIMSFFNENVQMYEVHNDGKEYNLGYLLGVAIVFLLLGFSGRRR
jgi:uncharacterized lipoprotein YehR (DUF1307 family)